MANPTRYDPAKHYTLSGQTLNALYEQLAGCKLLEAPGYKVDRSPGRGQKLKLSAALAQSQNPWGLYESGGEWYVRLGRIYTSYEDIDGYLTIVDGTDPVSISSGGHVYLALTNLADPVITLSSGGDWTGHPKLYNLVDLETTPKVDTSIFPLWSFIEGEIPENENGFQIHPDYYARQFHRVNDLIITYGSYELTDTFRHVPIPVLAPY